MPFGCDHTKFQSSTYMGFSWMNSVWVCVNSTPPLLSYSILLRLSWNFYKICKTTWKSQIRKISKKRFSLILSRSNKSEITPSYFRFSEKYLKNGGHFGPKKWFCENLAQSIHFSLRYGYFRFRGKWQKFRKCPFFCTSDLITSCKVNRLIWNFHQR